MANKEIRIGKAYGFFYCSASRQEIEAELPTIRTLAQTPSQLELSLMEDMDTVTGDKELTALAQEAKLSGINYMLKARYHNNSNRETADEVAAILNQAYQSPLFEPREQFIGEIVYEQNGQYVFRD